MTQPSITTQKDDDYRGAIFGISCVDGVTPVKIMCDSQGYIFLDTTTVISIVPKEITQIDGNSVPVAKGVSSGNSKIILPFYVNPNTGAILAEN